MLKDVLGKLFGTRHQREAKRVKPIIEEIHRHEAALASLDDATLQAQTTKFREILAQRTGDLEARVAALKDAKKSAADPNERDRIDDELTGTDGRSGAEGQLRTAVAEVLDELLPEAFATVREAARRLKGSAASVTGHPQVWDMVPYDVQPGPRHSVAPRAHRGNGDRRRQDPRRHPAALPERAGRSRRASGDRQLLPRAPRLAVDGAPLLVARPDGGVPR
ncbi:MAG: hypothetical protein U5K74_06715 [Gemmatimonadaceae bacterium]|nr:hypothetical protein [Gemmatimonadaceae bacterium]